FMHKYTENQCIVNLLSGKLLTISKLQKGGLFRQTVVARGANPECMAFPYNWRSIFQLSSIISEWTLSLVQFYVLNFLEKLA
ncbi:MAG: hypothetical protein K1X82_12750, partial [Bacteroidia bacterium]|nr:hypothetical protein [Bacteroidia bacterium]